MATQRAAVCENPSSSGYSVVEPFPAHPGVSRSQDVEAGGFNNLINGLITLLPWDSLERFPPIPIPTLLEVIPMPGFPIKKPLARPRRAQFWDGAPKKTLQEDIPAFLGTDPWTICLWNEIIPSSQLVPWVQGLVTDIRAGLGPRGIQGKGEFSEAAAPGLTRSRESQQRAGHTPTFFPQKNPPRMG